MSSSPTEKSAGPTDDQGQAFADRPIAPTAETVLRRQALQREREAQRLAAPVQFMDPAPALESDTLWRSLSRNGELRVLVVRATQTVAEAARRLECSADVTKVLGELMIGTLLVRSTLNPDDQLQITLEHEGPLGRVTVDAWREGGMRAYVAHPQEEQEAFGFLIGAGTLLVARSAGVGVPGARNYSSTTALDGNSVADYFMNYLLDSEQILSLLQTDVAVAPDGTLQHAVGYLVQLMPEGKRGDIQKILENLAPLPPLHEGMTQADPDARAWASTLLNGFAWDQCAREAVAFLCRCSRHRMLSMLSTLPKRDLQDLAAGSGPLELLCDYCRERYEVRPAELRVFLAEPS